MMISLLLSTLTWCGGEPTPVHVKPLVGCPTADFFDLALVNGAEPVTLEVAVRAEGAGEYQAAACSGPKTLAANAMDRLRVQRPAGPSCEYRVRGSNADGKVLFQDTGRVRAPRKPGETFSFAVFSDTHLFIEPIPYERAAARYPPWWPTSRSRIEEIARGVMKNIAREQVDFAIGLGDYIDLHSLGFNVPFPDRRVADIAFHDLRRVLSELGGATPVFAALGNWDGENGEFPEAARTLARTVRLLALPNPGAGVYPEGGSAEQNYFAFTWGDVLCVVLDVMGPTKTRHTLDPRQDPALATAWTLGPEQMSWLERVLGESKARDKMLFVHHTVGGRGGNPPNSVYGRGGGRAAKVGEQARVHELMQKTGARYFIYGHDHVFTHMEVDGIHYVCPGSAGAPWLFGQEETGYERDWKRSGHLQVTVTPSEIQLAFVGVTGGIFHQFSVPRSGP
jgi:predicted phosphodiesterase